MSADTENIIVEVPPSDNADSSLTMGNGNGHDHGLEEDDDEVVSPYQKRKRASVNYNQEDDNSKFSRGSPVDEPSAKRSKMSQKMRGVIIGVWRDSSEPNDEDKHVIYGFIDIHDRLRTRIYASNRRGEELIGNIPTGAGGCWVTFPRIIFDSHLKSLNSAEVKEYVKIRSASKPEPNEELSHDADLEAVHRAMGIVAAQEAASPGGAKPSPNFTNGRPATSGRPPLSSRPSLNTPPSFKPVNVKTLNAGNQTPKASPLSDKSPGVLLGYWADSDEPNDADKHAVFGVIGGTDSFRVKVQRVTRDGRFVEGNFPTGAGALWLHYEKLVLNDHLAGLSRPEVKEYVRIRQTQMDAGETDKERKINEINAVKEAKAALANSSNPRNGVHTRDEPEHEPELRHSARSEHRLQARLQAEADAQAERARKEKVEARERQNDKSRKEVAEAEAAVAEAAQAELKNNLKKLNKVWVAQQAATIPNAITSDEVKYYNGIKYERKRNGPFEGKLVSQPQLMTIDGEDFVEYRLLTKPSF